jgi:hypothetical protein
MSSLAHVSEAMQHILSDHATALERPTGFVKRSSAQLRGAVFVQSLVFGFLANPARSAIANCGMLQRAWESR